jgi:hypothetical protein
MQKNFTLKFILVLFFSLFFFSTSFSQTLKYAGTLPISHHLSESQKLFAEKVLLN